MGIWNLKATLAFGEYSFIKLQNFHRGLAHAICFLCASHLSAKVQSVEDPHTTRLDDITITARSLDNSTLLVPAQQLSGAALAQRQGSTLGETLDNLPGIANSSFGPNVRRPVTRGLGGDRIRILQNSGANMDVSVLSFDHSVPIDLLTTERIEVLRGSVTLLYGGSAIGGVVNVIDNRTARKRAFDAKGGVMGKAEVCAGGAANERSTGAMVETGTDKFAIHVDAFDRSTKNLKMPKNMSCASGVNSVKVCNSDSNTKGGAVNGTLSFDKGYPILKDDVDFARKNLGKLDYATVGGGTPEFLGAILAKNENLDIASVPYTTTADALPDALTGRVAHWITPMISAVQVHKGAKIRILAVGRDTRSELIKDIPIIKESGHPALDVSSVYYFFAPAGTPAGIVQQLNAAAVTALASPTVIQQLA